MTQLISPMVWNEIAARQASTGDARDECFRRKYPERWRLISAMLHRHGATVACDGIRSPLDTAAVGHVIKTIHHAFDNGLLTKSEAGSVISFLRYCGSSKGGHPLPFGLGLWLHLRAISKRLEKEGLRVN